MDAEVWLEEFLLSCSRVIIHFCISICDILSLRETSLAGFPVLLFLCLLHPTTPVCKVRLCVEFQENSLIPEIIFSVLNQILSQRPIDSTDFLGSVPKGSEFDQLWILMKQISFHHTNPQTSHL